jgi:hypothetical protein
MPVRTLNYTNRLRIKREHARIIVRDQGRGKYYFDATLGLSGYPLPGEAAVYVEAYRQAQYMRFSFGKVGSIHIPNDRVLRDFDSAEGILFRVKVVTRTDPKGLLLAEADQIRPLNLAEEDSNLIPLLPVKPDANMGDEIWRIDFDDQETLLLINSTIGDWHAMAQDPVFLALVYPMVFRTVLLRILGKEDYRDTEDMDDWRARWLRFAITLGLPEPPDTADEPAVELWIDNAVAAFARRHDTRSSYFRYWTGVQQQ